MKKQSKKNQLITAIIESGRPWKFTEMQRFIWNLTYPNTPMTRDNRGFWATNFSSGTFAKGHMLGGGTGCIYKTPEGWMAKFYSKEEIAKNKILQITNRIIYKSFAKANTYPHFSSRLFFYEVNYLFNKYGNHILKALS